MSTPLVGNFVKQQGFPEQPADPCDMHFSALCLGAYVYHLLRGRIGFANSTLPWAGNRR